MLTSSHPSSIQHFAPSSWASLSAKPKVSTYVFAPEAQRKLAGGEQSVTTGFRCPFRTKTGYPTGVDANAAKHRLHAQADRQAGNKSGQECGNQHSASLLRVE